VNVAVLRPDVDPVEPVALLHGSDHGRDPVCPPVEADHLAGDKANAERRQFRFDGGDQQRRVKPALLLQPFTVIIIIIIINFQNFLTRFLSLRTASITSSRLNVMPLPLSDFSIPQSTQFPTSEQNGIVYLLTALYRTVSELLYDVCYACYCIDRLLLIAYICVWAFIYACGYNLPL